MLHGQDSAALLKMFPETYFSSLVKISWDNADVEFVGVVVLVS